MNDMRKRIERGFEHLARWLYRHPILSLALIGLVAASMISQVPKITVDTSDDGFMHEDDPALLDYNAFRDQFGRDEIVIVSVQADDVLSIASLKRLEALHSDLEDAVPYMDDITSLVNARNTRGEADELIVEDLLDHWPETPDELAALRARVMRNPLYRNLLISADGRFTVIAIKTNTYSGETESVDDLLAGFDVAVEAPEEGTTEAPKHEYLTDEENSAVVAAVRAVASRHDAPDFRIRLAGSPVVIDALKQAMMHDMRKFLAMALGMIVLFLFALFRRVSGVVLPVLVVVLTLLSTMGLMAATGTPIKIPTQILPSFLFAVGVGAAVHLMAIFFRRLKESGGKEDAVVFAMGHSGLPILMTCLTTAAGLASFATAEIAPIADLGRFASAGVMLSLFYTIFLIPPVLRVIPLKARPLFDSESRSGAMDRLLIWIGEFSVRRAWAILAVSAVLVVLSGVGISKLVFGHYPLEWFPEGSEILESTRLIDREMRGTTTMEVVVDTGRENGLYDPAVLNALNELKLYAEAYDDGDVFVGKTQSVADILMEINRALNEDRDDAYVIPQDRALIAQELLLFENSGSDDLEDFVDSQFSKGRFMAKLPFVDAVKTDAFIRGMRARTAEIMGPDVTVTFTGIVPLFARTIHNAIITMRRSYVSAGLVIAVMMILLIGRFGLGLMSMIPNLLPIVLTMGFMGFAGLRLDLFSMLIGSIAIGLAVDDTVHFLHNFRRYHEAHASVRIAVRETLLGTGRAMLITTCVLSVGFFVFTLSSMQNLSNFGLLTGMCIIVALLADYFLTPALLAVFYGEAGLSAETEAKQ